MQLKGKHALVGGSSRGIGKAVAIELANRGANVTLLARNIAQLGEVAQALDRSQEQRHDFLAVDFSNAGDLRKRIQALILDHPVDILINNTGGPKGGPLSEAAPTQFLEAFNNHLICNQMLSQMVIPGMQSRGYGRIINIISTSVKQPIPGLGVSNTIRGAVASWAKTLANEVGVHGITVNNILPGFTATERLAEIIAFRAEKGGISEEQVKKNMEDTVPLGRFAQPSEIAAAVAFLASPLAGYINGINLPVDGGRTKSL